MVLIMCIDRCRAQSFCNFCTHTAQKVKEGSEERLLAYIPYNCILDAYICKRPASFVCQFSHITRGALYKIIRND